ncbi:TonB-dependent receptor [Sphingomonas sp. SCN 67-18]|uniref:TonB-dependent receptor domain-containing protein n=1 Tax=uncultured Sphingomonas sp. TaxID=158754 RepID=UPI000A71856D|nr:TonB-dependent receptor [Sphingomonas sp. SCN 67-18]
MKISHKSRRIVQLLLTTSLVLFEGTAFAQEAPGVADEAADSASQPDIVVTGSRITTSGYTQPTPVTVVGEEVLQRDAKVSIGDSIRELPAVGVSASPRNGGNAGNIVGGITGIDTVNLRQLGINRTLVLFDGQRVLASNITGGVDLGTIPTALVSRVDVVTGGASAAWGSDAVAGVVNLVLNRQFDGIRASIEGGESYKFDNKSLRLSFAAGTSFADDRGRVIVAANHLTSPDTVFASQRSYSKRLTLLVNNPNYTPTNSEPRLIRATNVGLSQATQGGLITGGPLRGIQFVGPNATPTLFDFGNVSNTFSNGGDAESLWPATGLLTVEYKTTSLFGYASYELSDAIRASVQLNYGRTWSRNASVPALRLGSINIRNDNAYLPQSIKDLMAEEGVTTIPVGTTNVNNLDLSRPSLDAFEKALGIPVATTKRELKRAVLSLDGSLGDWTWNAYYQRGELDVDQRTRSNVITANYAFAVDAIRHPVTGEIVCRATVPGSSFNAAAAGCVPLNIFGVGNASQAAINYVNTRNNFQRIALVEDVVAVSAQGTLPVGFAAGNIAVALGGEYRSEKGNIVADPGAAARAYSVANFSPFSGKYSVKEGFLEVDIPILKDNLVESFSLNGAGRVTDYSTSGTVYTWKVGLTSQLNSSIRVRGTVSRDIRAPNLAELFNSGVATRFVVPDPVTGEGVSIITLAGGNAALKPEKAKTYSLGVVLTPSFIPRLSASLDYYSIKIDDAIYSVGAPQVLSRCIAGETAYCSQIEYDGDGKIQQIRLFPLNVNSDKTSGIDAQIDYSTSLGSGKISARLLGNYILTQEQVILGRTVNYAGSIGGDAEVSGIPKLRGTASLTYDQGPLSLTGQLRFVGKAKLKNEWTAKDVDNNRVPSVTYVDIRSSYEISDNINIFAAIDNVTNVAPPALPMSSAAGQTPLFVAPISGTIYDTIGRSYRAGVRFNF